MSTTTLNISELQCAICQDTVTDPIELVGCEHIFCRECIKPVMDTTKACPSCREPITAIKDASRVIRNLAKEAKESNPSPTEPSVAPNEGIMDIINFMSKLLNITKPNLDVIPTAERFQIFVSDGRTRAIWIDVSETVIELKKKIEAVTGIKPGQMFLNFMGKPLVDKEPPSSYKLSHGNTIQLGERCLGG